MRYRNVLTGACIDSPCFLSGGDWVLADEVKERAREVEVKEEAPLVEKEEGKGVETPEEKKPKGEELTKKDICRELDAFGVDYSPRATKAELLALMKEML